VYAAPEPPIPSVPKVPALAVNRVTNSDFAQGPPPDKQARPGASSDWGDAGAPAGWSYWQEEFSKGRFDWDEAKKAARIRGVMGGTYLQSVPVKPGERYVVRGRCQTQGTGLASLTVGYKADGGNRWLPVTVRVRTVQPARREGAKEIFELLTQVPGDADTLVIQLDAAGQPTERDIIWWEKAEVLLL
jgi:hypothetical protein